MSAFASRLTIGILRPLAINFQISVSPNIRMSMRFFIDSG